MVSPFLCVELLPSFIYHDMKEEDRTWLIWQDLGEKEILKEKILIRLGSSCDRIDSILTEQGSICLT